MRCTGLTGETKGIHMPWRILSTIAAAAVIVAAATWGLVVMLSEIAQQQADANVQDDSSVESRECWPARTA